MNVCEAIWKYTFWNGCSVGVVLFILLICITLLDNTFHTLLFFAASMSEFHLSFKFISFLYIRVVPCYWKPFICLLSETFLANNECCIKDKMSYKDVVGLLIFHCSKFAFSNSVFFWISVTISQLPFPLGQRKHSFDIWGISDK